MQIGQAGKIVEGGRLKQKIPPKLMFEGHTEGGSGLICGYSLFSLYSCYTRERGSDGVEDRLDCCLTSGFSSLLSPICLGNHAPRCREKGRVGGSEENPAD